MGTEPTCEASLEALAARAGAEAERYEADMAGGGKSVRRQAVRCEHVTAEPAPGAALHLTC